MTHVSVPPLIKLMGIEHREDTVGGGGREHAVANTHTHTQRGGREHAVANTYKHTQRYS